MMDARLKVEKPDDIVFELSVKMTAKEWEKLRDNISLTMHAHYYSGTAEFVSHINDLLSQARKIYWSQVPKPPDDAYEVAKSRLTPAAVLDLLRPKEPIPHQYANERPLGEAELSKKLVTLNDMIFDEHGPAAPAPTYEQGVPVTREDRLRWADEMRDGL